MVIQTKYDVGGKFWIMRNNKPEEITVDHIQINTILEDDEEGPITVIWYKSMKSNPFNEDEVFATKEELIASL